MHLPQNELLLYRLFLSYPERAFYMQEIGRILGKKPGVFQRTLNKIEAEGFIKSEFKANARFFKLNREWNILKELTGIIKKIYGEINVFRNVVEKLDAEQKTIHRKPKEKKQTDLQPKKRRVKLSDFQKGEVMTTLNAQYPLINEQNIKPQEVISPFRHPSSQNREDANNKTKNSKNIQPSKQQLELF